MTENAKRGPGRPRVPDGRRQTRAINVRFTETQFRAVQELKRQTGQKPSTLMRRLLMEAAHAAGIQTE